MKSKQMVTQATPPGTPSLALVNSTAAGVGGFKAGLATLRTRLRRAPLSCSSASPNQLLNVYEHLESIIDGHLKPLQSIRKKKTAEAKLKTMQIENPHRALKSASINAKLIQKAVTEADFQPSLPTYQVG